MFNNKMGWVFLTLITLISNVASIEVTPNSGNATTGTKPCYKIQLPPSPKEYE